MPVTITTAKTISFTRFRAEGFADLDPVEVDGPTMFEALRGPMDARKAVLLAALRLLESLLVHGETDFGPPLQLVTLIPFGPDHVMAHGRSPVVISADVVVDSEDYKTVGRSPAVLSLDTVGITLRLDWDGSSPGSTIERFVVGHNREFARVTPTIPECQDLHLGVQIVVHMVGSVLTAARTPRPTGVPRPALGDHGQLALDAVAEYVLAEGAVAPKDEALLCFPRGKAGKEAGQAAVEHLVRQNYLARVADGEGLLPTLTGLMACVRAEDVVGVAERLLDYIAYRAERERGRFTQYSLDDLEHANVVGHDQFALARVVIAFFQLGDGTGTVWRVPADIVELRGIDDISGLLERCEQLRREEEARAAKEREARAREEAEAKRLARSAPSTRDRFDATWHRLRDWTRGQAASELLAAQILLHDGFTTVDPSHPRGGPDGGKDATLMRDGMRWIMAVYFPVGQHDFKAIKKKFLDDLRGLKTTNAVGMAFVTNQELKLGEREELRKEALPDFVELYHLDRISTLLDGPGPDTARLRKLYLDLDQ